MSRKCSVCKRSSIKSVSRSHSNIATKKRQYINLQTKKIDGEKIKICTSCIKTKNKKLEKGE
ncbi:50S ribosomal protein L28 [Candidatus Kuenenbacteria bacterium HGW-Kuenenbacteria-1]|uniref:50S ribosomal protein L28 n=1 Tax=Candidatus Kuenenbacteria bacterium HGW-Kuenenbacteria-1 TaxID=2013812 RepID=A0A2N1UMY9_9BACT|nr:MAG: 50S ribosomal protein L28 [Candidatus Kuenenbacteria bacterium HGW-Kuenenbacteria-1]